MSKNSSKSSLELAEETTLSQDELVQVFGGSYGNVGRGQAETQQRNRESKQIEEAWRAFQQEVRNSMPNWIVWA